MYRAAPALSQTPLPFEIPLIVIQPRPRNRLLDRLPQPGFEVEFGQRGYQLLLELSGHGFGVDVEVIAEKFADVGVFVVADEGAGVVGVGGVDVHVGGL